MGIKKASFFAANKKSIASRYLILPSGTKTTIDCLLTSSKYVQKYHYETDTLATQSGIYTLEHHSGSHESLSQDYRKFAKEALLLSQIPIAISTDNRVSVPMVEAAKSKYPNLSYLSIDAHLRLKIHKSGTPLVSLAKNSAIKELVDHSVFVAARSFTKTELQRADADYVYYALDLHQQDQKVWISDIINDLKPEVYISVDLSAMDPSIIPLGEYSVSEGLTLRQFLTLIKHISMKKKIVGFDFVGYQKYEKNSSVCKLICDLLYSCISYVDKNQ